MHKLTALLLATVTVSLHAAPLPARDAVFSSVTHSRPAISSSGKWIASTAVSDGKLRVFPMAGGAPKDIGLPAGVQGQYYRWASGPTDALIVAVGAGERSDIYRFDAESGALTRVTDDSYTPAFALGMATNNYAFTYVRYKKGEVLQDLAPSGEMVDRQASGRHVPGYLANGERYLEIKPGHPEWTFTGGAKEASRGTVGLMQRDLRRAGGLMSISNDGIAWILSSHGQDTMGLFSLDTASGERKSVAQPPVDIRKVILDPITMTPDFIEYETTAPQRLLLNQRAAPDLKLLSSNGNGFPTLLDRSPNDRYWVIKYAHRDGTPRMVSFDRTTKKTAPLPAAVFSYVDSDAIRTRSFAIKRPDGIEVTGHVALPRAGVCEKKRCPVVLMAHGGPGARDYAAFDANRFWLTSRGIAVVSVNYRGSEGFGTRFMKMDTRQWAGDIPKDVNAGLEHALARFPLDRTRIAAIGTSFSGYLSLHLAATGTPLRCVVVDSASTDIVKFADRLFGKYGEKSDLLQRIGDSRIAADKEAMTRMSPSAQIDQLKAIPVLHFHGGRDDITYLEDSQQFSSDMQAANPRYTFVGMPEASHGLFPGRDQYYALSEAFLGKCLGVEVQPITPKEAEPFSGYQIKGDRSFMQL